ncbi:MAG: hypothetical protein VB102_06630 [Paludibacter sp.]|nr:hypothetical protein [Paludibacter sp.]
MNKNSYHLLVICLLTILFSCQKKYTRNECILQAEKILFQYPDSAYQILNNINIAELDNPADYAAWCLHLTHAQYKTYRNILSDSLLNYAKEYYCGSKFPVQEGTVYYLYGCLAELRKHPETAMKWYKEADYVLSETKAYDLSGLANYNMAFICTPDAHFESALFYLNKARGYFNKSGNKKYQAYVYRDIGNILYKNDAPTDSVLYYINMAIQYANLSDDSINYMAIRAIKGEILFSTNPVESKNMILQYLNYQPQEQYRYTAYLAYIYDELNQPDSARYFYNRSKNNLSTTKQRFLNNIAGMSVEKYNKNYQKAFEHLLNAYYQRDTLFQKSIQSQIHIIDKQFDYAQKEKENLVLKISNRNKIIYIFSLTTALLIIGIILFVMISLHRKKILIKDFEQQRLESNLKVLKETHENKKQLLLNKLHNRTQNTLYLKRLEMGLKDKNKIDEFKDKITKQSIISELDWKEYMNEADQFLDEKISMLAARYPLLKENDIRIVTLICLNFDITDCSTLLNTTKETLYHRRVLIKTRLGLDKKTDLDKWLTEYVKST